MIFLFIKLLDIQNCERIIKHYADKGNSKLCLLVLQKFVVLGELIRVLAVAHNATIYFQNKTITLSDVYSRWMGMQLHLEHLDVAKKSPKTGFAKHLFVTTKSKKERIFNNPLMSCALFLDPRFHSEICQNPQKVAQAKENMLTIWRRLNILRSNEITAQAESTNVSSGSVESDFDEQGAIAIYLQRHSQSQSQSHQQQNENIPMQNVGEDIETIIEVYQPSSIPQNSKILEYWESVKEEHSELYRIAMVVFSIPPTEVAIERDFSHLDCVFTKRRGNLCQSRLEEIFVIHLNSDLFHIAMEEEVNELYKALELKDANKKTKKKLKF